MYKVLSVVDNLADIVSTDGNLNDLPTNYEIGSGCSYTDPSNGELHIKYYDEDPLRPGIAGDINCFNIFIL